MKKWIGLYLGLFLAVLIVGSGIAGLHTMKQAEFGAVCNAEGYASQIWTLDDSHYVLYQNPEQKKFQVANINKEKKEAVPLKQLKQKPKYNIKKLEDEISLMEDILEDKRALRFEPEYYQDMNKMAELDDEIDDIHNQIHALEEKWEEAMQYEEDKN